MCLILRFDLYNALDECYFIFASLNSNTTCKLNMQLAYHFPQHRLQGANILTTNQTSTVEDLVLFLLSCTGLKYATNKICFTKYQSDF